MAGTDAGEVQFLYAPLAPLELPEVEDELPFGTIAEGSLQAAKELTAAERPQNYQTVGETHKSAEPDKSAAVLPLDASTALPSPHEDLEDFIAFVDVPREGEPDLAEALADEEQTTSGQAALPWAKSSGRIKSPLLRLHNEIVAFCQALAPTREEVAARSAAIDRVRELIQATWPSAEVQIFGSFVTGLFLPTSDLDLVIVNSGCRDVRGGLRVLANGLTRKGMARNMQVIAKAKVPNIKFEEATSAFNFDISFDVANGPVAAEFVSQLMKQLPAMRSLVMVLKIFLQQREFNEVYTGGIGSYALLVMVAAFLMLHPSRQDGSQGETSLGVLLLDFFRLYGRVLHMHAVGISCRKGGHFFSKHARADPFLQPDRPYFLAVEDPKDPTNDLCKGSYQILKVRSAFEYAYQQLGAPAKRSESLLQRIIRVDKVLMGRSPPDDPASAAAQPGQAGGQQGQQGRKRRRSSESSLQPSSRESGELGAAAQAAPQGQADYMDEAFVQPVPEASPGKHHRRHRHRRETDGSSRHQSWGQNEQDPKHRSDRHSHREHGHKHRHKDHKRS